MTILELKKAFDAISFQAGISGQFYQSGVELWDMLSANVGLNAVILTGLGLVLSLIWLTPGAGPEEQDTAGRALTFTPRIPQVRALNLRPAAQHELRLTEFAAVATSNETAQVEVASTADDGHHADASPSRPSQAELDKLEQKLLKDTQRLEAVLAETMHDYVQRCRELAVVLALRDESTVTSKHMLKVLAQQPPLWSPRPQQDLYRNSAAS